MHSGRTLDDGRSTLGRVEGLDRLDYTIARLENKRLNDWDKPDKTSTHDWNTDAISRILPSLYRYVLHNHLLVGI